VRALRFTDDAMQIAVADLSTQNGVRVEFSSHPGAPKDGL
jgi:hypothetical protein